MPLIRQMLKFGARAIWLEIYRENSGKVIAEGARNRQNAYNELVNVGYLDPSEVEWLNTDAEEFRNTLKPDDSNSGDKFFSICNDIEGGDKLYAHYRVPVQHDPCESGNPRLVYQSGAEVPSGHSVECIIKLYR
jgi:hypothetical protein